MMTEPDVALTDFGLAIECFSFVVLLIRGKGMLNPIPFWFVVFFASLGSAALTGGTVHGFFLDVSSSAYRILWPLTLILIGVSSMAGLELAASIQFPRLPRQRLFQITATIFTIYCLIVFFVSQAFVVAIVNYFPVLGFLAIVFLIQFRRLHRTIFLPGFAGLCVMTVAAAAQRAKFNVNAHYFNYNALYHVLQGVGSLLVFVTARNLTIQPEARHH